MIGLKENVIIGKLVPAGTGMKCYTEVEIEPAGELQEVPAVPERQEEATPEEEEPFVPLSSSEEPAFEDALL